MAQWSRASLGGALAVGVVLAAGAVFAAVRYGGSTGTTAPSGTPAPGAASADHRPNVLIVLWDTTRADHLSLYGYDRPTTPNLDAFAKDATVYERATPTGMWTLVTHTSIFTGLTETESGAHASWLWLDDRYETLAERLKSNGYDTFAFSANIIVGPWTNLTQGFEHLYTSYPKFPMTPTVADTRYVQASRKASADKLIGEDASVELSPAFEGSKRDLWKQAVFKDAAPVAAQAFDDFLGERSDGDGPFFAYVNMMEAHSPRVPSMASREAVATPEELALGLKTDSSLYALDQYIVGKRTYTPEEQKAIASIYDASIHDLDAATKTIVDALKAHGVLDDTVVIVMADHGEALGEHQRYEHRWSLYEELTHVPLVIRYPAKFEPGKRIAGRVSTADVYATINELAGLPVPPGVHSVSLVGRSDGDGTVYAQLLDPFAQQLASMAETYPELDLSPWQQSYCAEWQDDWKLTWATGGDKTLFDLSKDPREEHSLYADEPDRVKAMEQALYDWEKGLTPYDPSQRSKMEQLRQCYLDELARRAKASTAEQDQLVQLGYAAPDTSEVPWRDYCGPYGVEVERQKEVEERAKTKEQLAADAAAEEERQQACEQALAAVEAKAGKAGKAGKAKGKAKAKAKAGPE